MCDATDNSTKKTHIQREEKKNMNKKKQLHEKQIYTQFLSTFKWNIKMVSLKQHAMYVNTFTFDEASDFILYSWWKNVQEKYACLWADESSSKTIWAVLGNIFSNVNTKCPHVTWK